MSTYGRQSILTVGKSVKVTADGEPQMKSIGVTLDWSLIAAVSGSDVVLPDGVTVRVGEKYVRFGQVLCKVTATGKYAPYDTAASNGQQTIARGSCWIVGETVKENDLHSDHPPVLDGGRVWKDRLLITAGTHSLAAGPTVAEFEAAFPRISYVAESPT